MIESKPKLEKIQVGCFSNKGGVNVRGKGGGGLWAEHLYVDIFTLEKPEIYISHLH